MQARPAQAQQDLEKALAIRELLEGPQSLQLADTLNSLGMAHRLQQRYGEAERYYRRALAIQRAHPPTAELGITLNNLGQLAAARGRSKQALELFHQAVETWEGLPGPPNPGMATALNQAGVLAYKNKQYAEATALLEKAGSAEALLNLGAAHLKEKRFHESAQAYQRAVELLTRQWGPGDERLAAPLDHLAFVLRKDEQFADAAEVELQATRIRVATALR
jgi:tetratricopeptide (TPR) repeat protein